LFSIWDKSEVLWRPFWGTHWELGEHKGNLVGTNWEPGINEKKILSPLPTPPFLPPNLKGKKSRHFDSMPRPSHSHESSLPKRVHHHFWPGLIALAKNTLPIITHDIIFQ